MTVTKTKIIFALILVLGLFSVFTFVILIFQFNYKNRIYPGVGIAGVDLGGLDRNEAIVRLTYLASKPDELVLVYNSASFNLPNNLLKINYNFEESVDEALAFGKSDNSWNNFKKQYQTLLERADVGLSYSIDNQYLNQKIIQISNIVDKPVEKPALTLSENKVIVSKGKLGQKLNQQSTLERVDYNLAHAASSKIPLAIDNIGRILSEVEQTSAQTKAQALLGKELVFVFGEQTWKFNGQQILDLLTVTDGSDQYLLTIGSASNLIEVQSISFENELYGKNIDNQISLKTDQEKLVNLVGKIASEVNRPAKDALFQFEQGKVIVFQPSVDGQNLNQQKLITQIDQTINTEEKSITVNLPVEITPAKTKTAEVNDLGINELIGQGKSTFNGSSAERMHNIKLATSRVNGILVPPGENFSFNNTIGEISLASGYSTAYIISKGRTVLGEGGGVCQVSTTVFRAILNSGLPIEERHAHAYRVSYYEQTGSRVGLDATIYSPKIDLRFKNDTGKHILIQGYVKGTSLFFDFYGTKDGRVVNISNPQISNVQPAPPPIYEDDPTLPKGTIKQVDFTASGANVRITRTVTKNGETMINEVFNSRYKPWQAIYKVGTKES